MCVSTFKDILKFKFGVFLLRDDKNILYTKHHLSSYNILKAELTN